MERPPSPVPSQGSTATPLVDNRTHMPVYPGRGRALHSSRGGPTYPRNTPPPIHASSGVPFGHVPAYLPGAASLVEELDQRILLVLRDGKHIIGTLVSFDQFGNLVLKNAVDRQMVRVSLEEENRDDTRCRHYYADLPLDGLYIARGESLVLVGAVEDDDHHPLQQAVPLEELSALAGRALRPLEWDFDNDLIA